MSIIDDCVKFLEDLILGDFNEEQQVSAQLIGGLISLIPVVDQVMDVRDISGTLYRINKHGGFAKASLDQKIDFGFAAFGVIPEVGSAFKTVFKPLYKQRKAMKGVMNGGVAMIERMLGQKKGGAIKWVKGLDWAGNTQVAINQADMALNSCIELLDYIAQGHWWCPDRLEQLARDVSPGMKSLRGKLAAPIREAAAEIRRFLEDMLGEHAAAVALAVAGNAGSIRQAGARGGKSSHARVSAEPRANGKKAAGAAVRSVESIAYDTYKALNYAEKGLVGEHIVDHHIIEQKGWGLNWHRHDMYGDDSGKAAGWQSTPRKLNDGGHPIYLCNPSSIVLARGIDSAWKTDRAMPEEYAIVEAKANMNPNAALLSLLSEALDSSRPARKPSSMSSGRARRTTSAAPAPNPPAGRPKVMQMSRTWIEQRVVKELRPHDTAILRRGKNYTRHVFLVTPLQAASHLEALGKIVKEGLIENPAGAQKFAPDHAVHDVQREFGEVELSQAEAQYASTGLTKKPKKTDKK